MARRIFKRDRNGRFARVAAGAKAASKIRKSNKGKKPLRNAIKSARTPKAKELRKANRKKTQQRRNQNYASRYGVSEPQPDRTLKRRELNDIRYGSKDSTKQTRTKKQQNARHLRTARRVYVANAVARSAIAVGGVAIAVAGQKAREHNAARNINQEFSNARGLGAPLKAARRNRRGVYNITTM